eukprot:CAMPEP_0176056084 /NCGR_PEP_ID=MMETSP0120_2-20121206/27926_1 /TAXON_ID=160619 /ORGANISM="Kryptoperidinium foliaceum, Strain CCMP 1326" /LENGTH=679 /DNA_ID=CAMNT_0017389585 /DNA_START=82 /DNA_END=2117 /DNA_ORIENTATION=-
MATNGADGHGGPQNRTARRMEKSATGIGLRDWCFGASLLVKDCTEELEPDSVALQRMLEAIYSAAVVLNDDNWRRFNELVWDRVHCQDHEVHGALFAKVEPTWRALLTTPRGGSTCVFLHIGTEPPSSPLCNLLTKLGWFGVIIGPVPPEPGNEDLVQHVQLDPGHERDRDEFIALLSPSGGKVPKPSQFLLAFVNCVFNPMDPDPDSDEEFLVFGQPKDEPATGQDDAGAEQEIANNVPSRYTPSWERAKFVTTPPVEKRMLSTASGFGKLGVTREPDVRKRLRTLNMSLSVALQRLKQGGSLVILWPALPCHPVMFFITASLRPLFGRVHVVANEGIKTFESYILCANFNQKKAQDNTPGEGGSAIRSFFGSAYRRPALDDVLLWTLGQSAEAEEALFGAGGASSSKTYDDLWELYAQKYKELAADLDIDVTKVKAAREKKQRAKRETDEAKLEKPEKLEKSGKTAKAKTKADGSRKASDKTSGSSDSKDAGAKAKAKSRPEGKAKAKSRLQAPAQQAPPRPEGAAGAADGAEGAEGADGSPSAAAVGAEVPSEESRVAEALANAAKEELRQLNRTKKKREQALRISRSAPTLACSLGAVPGGGGAPDRWRMAEQYAMIGFGHLVAQKSVDVRKFYRKRDDVGVSLAGDGVTASPDSPTGPVPMPLGGTTIPNWNGP